MKIRLKIFLPPCGGRQAEAVSSNIVTLGSCSVNEACGQATITREVSEIVGGREALAA